MGLHLHTKQSHGEAEIRIQGELTGLALAQLQAAIDHFRYRGCAVIHLNVERPEPWRADRLATLASSHPIEAEIAIR